MNELWEDLEDFEDDVNDWVWENPEADLEWEEMDELPSIEDVLEWQGKGWLWE